MKVSQFYYHPDFVFYITSNDNFLFSERQYARWLRGISEPNYKHKQKIWQQILSKREQVSAFEYLLSKSYVFDGPRNTLQVYIDKFGVLRVSETLGLCVSSVRKKANGYKGAHLKWREYKLLLAVLGEIYYERT